MLHLFILNLVEVEILDVRVWLYYNKLVRATNNDVCIISWAIEKQCSTWLEK